MSASRERTILLPAIACATALAWLAMGYGHTSHGGLLVAFAMWMVMMIAMMLPTVAPWIVFHSRIGGDRAGAPVLRRTGLFVAGYLAVWGLYSLAAAVAQQILVARALLDKHDLVADPRLGGSLFLAAGAFQLTPVKAACLSHCRSPVSYFLAKWQDGPAGSFRMGFRHGAFCVACCWALMALAFAVGATSIVFMAALTIFLCVEKIAPGGRLTGRVAGVALALWGVWLLVG